MKTRCILLFLVCVLFAPNLTSASCLGCLDLDEVTFYKVIPKFDFALVKFDIAFPYGDHHEAFGQVATKIHDVSDDVLVGLVGVKDYGGQENRPLGDKYNVDPKNFPTIILFRGNVEEGFIKYPEGKKITVDNLIEFVNENTDAYIAQDGCIREFDDLAMEFVGKEKADQEELMAVARVLEKNVIKDNQKTSAKYYMTYMEKILTKGPEFVAEEKARLTKLKSEKISDSKKVELSRKLNILAAFATKKPVKNEL